MKRIRQSCATGAATLIILLTAWGQMPKPQEATLAVGAASLSDVKGEVSIVTPQGQHSAAQRGQVVSPESAIETGKGGAVLNLQDGSQVLIKSRSRVVIKSPSEGKQTFLELLIGKVEAQVRKRLGNAPSFKMGTPSAVITVRGTRFTVEVTKKNRTIVDVYEGLVDVAGVEMGGSPVQLRPGFWTGVEPNGLPEEPRQLHDPGEHSRPGAGEPHGPGFESHDENIRRGNVGETGGTTQNEPGEVHPNSEQRED
jgi:FecR protein